MHISKYFHSINSHYVIKFDTIYSFLLGVPNALTVLFQKRNSCLNVRTWQKVREVNSLSLDLAYAVNFIAP